MGSNLYWISALTYAFILAVILFNEIRTKRQQNAVEKIYRVMVGWLIFFCLQDAFWGFCEVGIIPGETIFFISSTIFHISTALTTFFTLYYVLAYTEASKHLRIIYLSLDALVIIFALVLVIANFFTGCLFKIENGVYKTGFYRQLVFVSHYGLFFVTGIATFILSIKKRNRNDNKAKKYRIVFYATLATVVLGIFQFLYPDAPFYSLSYFLGGFILHIFVMAKDREESEKNTIFKSIANTFYSLHLIDLENDKLEHYIESESIAKITHANVSLAKKMDLVIENTCSEEYVESVKEFLNLETLSERMKGKTVLSMEFLGKNLGWTKFTFISVDVKNGKQTKVMFATQNIDVEKRQQIDLIYKSYNDQLTGLYNRCALAEEMEKINKDIIPENLVYVSMDVNGLKVINDSAGHEAGDELIRGAGECMKKCFSTYGKIFRTGGDEFNAIIYVSPSQLESVKKDFDDIILGWKGKNIESISVSCGYVTTSDVKVPTLHDMSVLADERMYEAKDRYYREKGIDRRGQKDAYVALCSLYTKILKINITDDSYQILNMDVNEQSREMGFSDKISQWFENFAKSGCVHSEDVEEYLKFTSLEYMRQYFAQNKSSLNIFYRRKYAEGFKKVMMELIPAQDYKNNNQTLYLYVNKIDK